MRHLKFGVFMAGVHAINGNPYLGIQQDLDLMEYLDKLGYNEAWIGEHHSAGLECIGNPELFIAMAAERTKHIVFGTGVTSLPYHHPLMVADTWMQLYNMTRGRVQFGCGPGSLVSDARMMGIAPQHQRSRMEEALGAISRLIKGETVTQKSDWFELLDAQVQMRPFDGKGPRLSTASMVSPSGPRAAGKYGTGLLSLSATAPAALAAAAGNWAIAEETAQDNGHKMVRDEWRMMALIHIAETRAQALADVQVGLDEFVTFFEEVGTLPLVPPDRKGSAAEHLIESGMAIIGSPTDAIDQIERLWEASAGGFGSFLLADTQWTSYAAKLRSYELVAQHVFPAFQDHNSGRHQSYAIARDKHAYNAQLVRQAIEAEGEKLEADRQRRKVASKPGT